MARVMLHTKNIPLKFWAEAINTACHIHNRISLRPGTNNTNYELWRERKPNVLYFHIFGSLCCILVDREPRYKFDVKSDEGIFLGYSRNSRALHVFNKRAEVVMESIIVKVLDSGIATNEEDTADGTPVNYTCSNDKGKIADGENVDATCDDRMSIQPASRIQKNHPVDNIIGQLDQGVTTRRKEPADYRRMVRLIGKIYFISKMEPKNVDEALKDEH
ncbi:hypothetical protein LIER_39730 [Lithospermum erythrorhizon]|uniref:Retroviral polymerase SH3-like domain-containing protein n=1 Tax=Lithospermum erythrorhizon TaxID=34254 RepID=A0AAV3QJ95_LITER